MSRLQEENPIKDKSSVSSPKMGQQETDLKSLIGDQNMDYKKPLQIENTEDVIKFSHLLSEVNRLLRYTSIINNETSFMVKIQRILMFDERMNAKLVESLLQGSQTFQRVRSKVHYLKNIYEYLSNHRAFLLDYTIMYLGAILHHMKVLKNLDYRRVLYVKNQISKCKSTIMKCIRDGCPNICNKYKESKYSSFSQETNTGYRKSFEDDEFEKMSKKIKTT